MSITKNITDSIIWLNERYRELNEQEKDDNNRVQLGRSFKIADKFQFDLASRLSQSLRAEKIIIDYPTSCTNRSQPLYPDIQLIDGNKLKAIIEIKIDLGFLRLGEFGITYDKSRKTYEYGNAPNRFMDNYNNFLSSQEIWYKKKSDKEKVSLKIDNSLKRIFIVVTQRNHTRRGPFFQQSMNDSKFNLLFLLDKIHPNTSKDVTNLIRQNIKEKDQEIRELFDGL